MYSLEEIKTLAFLIGAALLGRLLFYRGLAMKGSFKCRMKIRMLNWLWEIPVIMAIAIASFELVEHFEWRDSTGVLAAIVMGFVGLETIKVWGEDYLDSKISHKNPGRRETDDEH